MSTGLFTHPDCLRHVMPPGHPECVERLEAVLRALRESNLDKVEMCEAPAAHREALLRVHSGACVDVVLSRDIPEGKFIRLDADTAMSSGSRDAALRAAGALVAAVDAVSAGHLQNAFCAVRPPGHHAERERAMGFCLFNNVAVGALHARESNGFARIAVIDFDVHHGNGTQEAFYGDANLFYASTHQSPLYPGTGLEDERGVADNIFNVPLPPGAGSNAFRAAYEQRIIPALEAFVPDFIFISAGFDGHRADPLAQLQLDEDDFGWVTERLCALATRACNGRVVSTLEGGYDLRALGRSAVAHVRALTEA